MLESCLLLSERDLHGVRGRNLESIQSLASCTALNLRRELHESNVVTSRHQTNFFESRELVEQHAQHHLVGLVGKVGEEENLVGWLFGVRRLNGGLSWIQCLRLFGSEIKAINHKILAQTLLTHFFSSGAF
jgi:hypothetical protein